MPICWRNMFASICFLRILVKLMKNKPWRAIWLVKYKATNIFKKAMLVRHGMFQLYLLKVIKLHARFLGRPWRKANMDIVSAIYRWDKFWCWGHFGSKFFWAVKSRNFGDFLREIPDVRMFTKNLSKRAIFIFGCLSSRKIGNFANKLQRGVALRYAVRF